MAITFDGAPSSQALANYGQRLLPLLGNAPAQQQAQPPTSQETINQAVANGAQQAAEQHAQAQSINNAVQRGAQLQRGFLGGIPQSQNPNEQMALEFQRGLLGYKDQWNTAHAAGDEQGMADAAAGANVLRDYALKQGINLDNYYGGADNTRAQLAAAIDAQNDSRYGRLLSSPDSATYYDQVYNDAIAKGASRRVAQRYAGQQAQQYQAQRMADLQLALQDRGISHQGFLNSQGAQILAMMYDENPNGVAQVYNSYFGKPVNLGTWELAELSQDNANNRQRGLLGYQEELQEKYGAKNFDWTRALADDNFNYKRTLQKDQIDAKNSQLDKTLAAQIQMNADKTAATVAAAQAKGNSSSSSGVAGATKTELTEVQNAKDIFDAAKQTLSDYEGDNGAFGKLDKIKEKTSDPAVRNRIDAMKYALNAYREGVAWNDHGEKGDKQNFIDYYEAVAHDPENADLVAGLESLYNVAKSN